MRVSEGAILTLVVFVSLNKLCRSCSTGFVDAASQTVVSSVVFEGKMMHEVDDVPNPLKLSAARFKVGKILKGDLPENSEYVVIAARIANGKLDCLDHLRSNGRYIVFLSSTTDMVDGVAAYNVSGPPVEYSGKAVKDVDKHSCRNCVLKPSARIASAPRKLSSVKAGVNVNIKCVVKGQPVPLISWYRNDQPLSSMVSDHLLIKSQKSRSVLFISNVTSEDEANYWCQAVNVLATANSSTATLAIRKAGGGRPWEDVRGVPCEETYKNLCVKGDCHLLPDNSRYCVCEPGFTGHRCQDRGSELETSNIDVQTSYTDKALVFVALLLTLLIIATLIAILYYVARLRHDLRSLQQMVKKATKVKSPSSDSSQSEPLVGNERAGQPTVHSTEVEDTKSDNTKAQRSRLSAVSSVLDMDFDRTPSRAKHEETIRRKGRMYSSRVSTTSSNQGLLFADDDVDGATGNRADPHPMKYQHSTLQTCSWPERDARPTSGQSNYENHRLRESRNCIGSPRCKIEGFAVGSDLHKSPKVEGQRDAQKRDTEEVNNLLKELGVYVPEDGNNSD